MDAFSKMIALVLVVLGMIVVPTLIFAQQNDQVTQEYVSNATVEFVDNVLVQGQITQEMYESFVRDLDSTGMLFDIDLKYSKKVVTPGANGTFNTNQEVYYYQEVRNALYSAETTTGPNPGAVIDGEADGILHFVKGDYFSVTVKNKDATHANLLQRAIMRVWNNKAAIEVNYGGEVRDENYATFVNETEQETGTVFGSRLLKDERNAWQKKSKKIVIFKNRGMDRPFAWFNSNASHSDCLNAIENSGFYDDEHHWVSAHYIDFVCQKEGLSCDQWSRFEGLVNQYSGVNMKNYEKSDLPPDLQKMWIDPKGTYDRFVTNRGGYEIVYYHQSSAADTMKFRSGDDVTKEDLNIILKHYCQSNGDALFGIWDAKGQMYCYQGDGKTAAIGRWQSMRNNAQPALDNTYLPSAYRSFGLNKFAGRNDKKQRVFWNVKASDVYGGTSVNTAVGYNIANGAEGSAASTFSDTTGYKIFRYKINGNRVVIAVSNANLAAYAVTPTAAPTPVPTVAPTPTPTPVPGHTPGPETTITFNKFCDYVRDSSKEPTDGAPMLLISRKKKKESSPDVLALSIHKDYAAAITASSSSDKLNTSFRTTLKQLSNSAGGLFKEVLNDYNDGWAETEHVTSMDPTTSSVDGYINTGIKGGYKYQEDDTYRMQDYGDMILGSQKYHIIVVGVE